MVRVVLIGIILVVMALMLRSLLKRLAEEIKRVGVRGADKGTTPEGVGRCVEVLGLKPGASKKEINEAYRDLVNVWHPDRFANNLRLQKKAEERLKEINAAYEHIRSFYRWK